MEGASVSLVLVAFVSALLVWTGLAKQPGLGMLGAIVLVDPLIEKLTGVAHDHSVVAGVKGSWRAFALWMVVVWLVVAPLEEAIFRGFLMTEIARIVGTSTWAAVLNILLALVVFGLAHGYQGRSGVVSTGIVAAFLGMDLRRQRLRPVVGDPHARLHRHGRHRVGRGGGRRSATASARGGVEVRTDEVEQRCPSLVPDLPRWVDDAETTMSHAHVAKRKWAGVRSPGGRAAGRGGLGGSVYHAAMKPGEPGSAVGAAFVGCMGVLRTRGVVRGVPRIRESVIGQQ